jgi:hypothetical protein
MSLGSASSDISPRYAPSAPDQTDSPRSCGNADLYPRFSRVLYDGSPLPGESAQKLDNSNSQSEELIARLAQLKR